MKIYTDGSARPTNPGHGKLAIVVCNDNDEIIKTLEYSKENSTNNEMEMLAIVIALAAYGLIEEKLEIFSDSSYAVNTFTKWCFNWKENDWHRPNGKVPENLNIIQKYCNLLEEGYSADIIWVKGHNTCAGNILADSIARGDKTADTLLDF